MNERNLWLTISYLVHRPFILFLIVILLFIIIFLTITNLVISLLFVRFIYFVDDDKLGYFSIVCKPLSLELIS